MYGAGQNPGSLFGQLEKAIKNKDPIFNMTGGEQLRDYLPVEQVADYIVMLAGSQGAEGIFNVCSGKPISIRKIVEDFIAERGSSLRLNRGYYPYATHEPIAFWGDRQKLDHYRELL
jgi:dTDP-6-deoxy-L-talose 4-dehydrogenase (NAD+)